MGQGYGGGNSALAWAVIARQIAYGLTRASAFLQQVAEILVLYDFLQKARHPTAPYRQEKGYSVRSRRSYWDIPLRGNDFSSYPVDDDE